MAEIQIIAKDSNKTLANISGASATLKEPSIVLLKISPKDISMINREGTSVLVYLKNGEVVRIEHFFSETDVTDNSLVLGSGTEQLIWARFTNNDGIILNTVQYQPIENIEALLYSEESSNLLYWIGVPVAAGAVAVALNKDDDSSDGGNNTIKLDKPTNIKVGENGATITGKGQAGATVYVKDSKGNVLGSATVGNDGNFEVKLDQPLANGEDIKVSIKDPAGNTSEDVEMKVPDTTKPAVPEIVLVSTDGKTVTGKAEAKATIIIKDMQGKEIATGTVDEHGSFKIQLDPALKDGEKIKVSVKDAAGNISDEKLAKIPPQAPTVEYDGEVTVTGKTEPGATVEVVVNGKTIGKATAGPDGKYEVKLHEPVKKGDKITVIATDTEGNKSEAGTVELAAPTAEYDGDVLIKGETEPGATIVVYLNGQNIGSALADKNGKYQVKLHAPLKNGETIEVIAISGDRKSSAKEITVPDTTAPELIDVQFDGKVVTGKTEQGATVKVKTAAGEEQSVVAAADGTYKLTLATELKNGEEIEVTATDKQGNVSEAKKVNAPIATGDEAPVDDRDQVQEILTNADHLHDEHIKMALSTADQAIQSIDIQALLQLEKHDLGAVDLITEFIIDDREAEQKNTLISLDQVNMIQSSQHDLSISLAVDSVFDPLLNQPIQF